MKASALLLVGCLTGIIAGCGQPAKPDPEKMVVRYVEAEAAGAANLQSRAEYIALVRADVETELGFKVGGVLESIGRAGEPQDWQEGVSFARGDVLAQLKQEDFISAIKSTKARAELAAKEFERTVSLHQSGVASQQELDASSARKLASEADLAQTEQALQDSVLRVPYDGIILARFANAGETIGAGKTVLRVADMRQMSIEVGVPDRLVAQIQVGQEVPVKISALEASTFTGRVSEVGAATKEGARLYRVVIKVPNPQGLLKSGMTASVALGNNLPLPAGSVLVPLSALVSSAKPGATNQLAVFIIAPDGCARERLVKTDDLVRSFIVVTEGVVSGEKVVSVGASNLYDGAPVDPIPAEQL